MPRQQFEIWKYFKRYRRGKYMHGDCIYCNKSFIANPKRQKKHLLECIKAPISLKQGFCDKNKNGKSLSEQRTQKTTILKPSEAATSSDPDGSNVTQISQITQISSFLDNFLDRITDTEQEEFDTLLARAIYSSASPFALVENKFFKQFMLRIRPSYKLPSRYKMSHGLLEKEYQLVESVVRTKIAKASSIVILTDGWTDVNGISLINIILFSPVPIFYKTIDSKTVSHTGEYMSKIIEECIEDIGADKVEGIVTDNARNMVSAWNLLKNKYPKLVSYGCIAHGLNLLLKDLFRLNSLSKYAALAKDIIKFYKNKHIPKQVLKEVQLKEINKEIALITCVDTRWGSVVASLKSLSKNKDFLQETVLHKSVKPLINARLRRYILDDDDFWPKIMDIIELTSPIADMITNLEGDKPLLSKVHRYLHDLQEHFYSDKIDFLPQAEIQKVQEAFEHRKQFMKHPIHLAANLLDPKEMGAALSEDEVYEALNFISEFAELRNLDSVKIFGEYSEYKLKTNTWRNQTVWKTADNTEPTQWWKAFFEKKELTKVAVKILNFPATAASCERNWKDYSLIKTKKRNRLTIDRTHKLVFIKFNLDLLEPEDFFTVQSAPPNANPLPKESTNNLNDISEHMETDDGVAGPSGMSLKKNVKTERFSSHSTTLLEYDEEEEDTEYSRSDAGSLVDVEMHSEDVESCHGLDASEPHLEDEEDEYFSININNNQETDYEEIDNAENEKNENATKKILFVPNFLIIK